jgi:WD40 repeat protein
MMATPYQHSFQFRSSSLATGWLTAFCWMAFAACVSPLMAAPKATQILGSGTELLALKHAHAVVGVAFSPDGKRLASASQKSGTTTPGLIKIWDAETGAELLQVKVNHPIRSIAFSPDGKRLVSACADGPLTTNGVINVWDSETGQELLSLKHSDAFTAVFSADGTRLISSGASLRNWDISTKQWDAATGQELLTLEGVYLASSPDGKQLALCVSASSFTQLAYFVKVCDATTGLELLRISNPPLIHTVAFQPDGKLLLASGLGKSVTIADATTGRSLLALNGEGHRNPRVAFSPDGKSLAAVYESSFLNPGNVQVWDLASGQQLIAVKHGGRVSKLAFNASGDKLVTAGDDQTVRVWNLPGQELFTAWGNRPYTQLTRLAFSPDGKRLAAGAKVFDAQTGQHLLTVNGHQGHVYAMAFSPDGKRLASASSDMTAKISDAEAGTSMLTLWEHNANKVLSVAFSPSGQRLASTCSDKIIRVWDTTTGAKLFRLQGHARHVNSVAFSPDGKRLASAGGDHTVKIWYAETGQPLLTMHHGGQVLGIAFTPDGKHLASCSVDKSIKIWETATGREVFSLDHNDAVHSVAFSPDARRLISSCADKTVKLWDVATRQELLTYRGHNDPVVSVVFSPDGRQIASAGLDGTVRMWALSAKRAREY